MWKHLIQHLTAKGYSQYTLAKAAGVNQATISRMASGGHEPRYSVGRALMQLADSDFLENQRRDTVQKQQPEGQGVCSG